MLGIVLRLGQLPDAAGELPEAARASLVAAGALPRRNPSTQQASMEFTG
jgi:hypothetical protein